MELCWSAIVVLADRGLVVCKMSVRQLMRYLITTLGY